MQFNVDYLGRFLVKLMHKTREAVLRVFEMHDVRGVSGSSNNTPRPVRFRNIIYMLAAEVPLCCVPFPLSRPAIILVLRLGRAPTRQS